MEIIWTAEALNDLENIIDFWIDYTGSNTYSKKIQQNIEEELYYIQNTPQMYPYTDFENIRRALILRNFSLFFFVDNNQIKIIRFWDNRRNPKTLKF